MFIGRKKELEQLVNAFESGKKTAVLIYGKRRIGKSTLIAEAAKSFDGAVVNYLCVQSTFAGNLNLLCREVSLALGLPEIQFSTIMDLFLFLGSTERRILVVLDEYQYLKESSRKGEVDSFMQVVIDRLPENVSLILCGSYITVMKELIEEDNPLFGRFTEIIHLREFDYYDAAGFYPDADVRRKLENYAVFGGSPYVLSCIDGEKTTEENVKKFLLPPTGILRSYIENIMLKEIQKSYDVRILAAIGNGKKKYSEINAVTGNKDSSLLSKQLKNLIDMETIERTAPINRADDKKKTFYAIQDNLMRFYFTFLFGNNGILSRIGPDNFYAQYIEKRLTDFIARRFEGEVRQFFSRQSRNGARTDILDIGSYWYDDPETRANGEFDCVLKTTGGYEVYECKFYKNPMSYEECRKEELQVRGVKALQTPAVGFVCSAGFAFDTDQYLLVSGNDLFK